MAFVLSRPRVLFNAPRDTAGPFLPIDIELNGTCLVALLSSTSGSLLIAKSKVICSSLRYVQTQSIHYFCSIHSSQTSLPLHRSTSQPRGLIKAPTACAPCSSNPANTIRLPDLPPDAIFSSSRQCCVSRCSGCLRKDSGSEFDNSLTDADPYRGS